MLRTLLAANYKTHAETQWIMTVRLGGLVWAGLGWSGLMCRRINNIQHLLSY